MKDSRGYVFLSGIEWVFKERIRKSSIVEIFIAKKTLKSLENIEFSRKRNIEIRDN